MGTGGDNGLALKVSRFRPELRCYGKLAKDDKIVHACQGLAETMSTSTTAQTFGNKGSDSSGLDPDVILPITRKSNGTPASIVFPSIAPFPLILLTPFFSQMDFAQC